MVHSSSIALIYYRGVVSSSYRWTMAALPTGIDAEALYWEALKGRLYFRHPWTPNYSQAETNKLRPLNRAAIPRHWSKLWRLLKLQPIQPVDNSA